MDENQSQPQLPEEPVLVPPRGLWAVALGLFGLTAVAALLWAPPVRPPIHPKLHLEFWRDADVEAMHARDDALLTQLPKTPTQSALEVAITAQFELYLQREVQLAGRAAEDPEARLLLGQVEESVRSLVQQFGADALKRLSVRFGRDVRGKAEKALAGAAKKQQPFELYLQNQPMPQDVSELTAVAGALGRVLARTGIARQLHAGVLDPAAGQVVETLGQARFLQLGARIPGGPPQLSSDAWFMVQRFRVEAHQGLDVGRRLALLDELAESDPTYPADYARGVILAREERFAEATGWFERAAKRGGDLARQARDNARWSGQRALDAPARAPEVLQAP